MLTIPNLLTWSRFFIVIPIFFFYQSPIICGVFLGIAVLSDFLDGYLARKWNQTSSFGALLDPIADKYFIISLSIFLVLQDQFPLWFAALLWVRNFSQLMAIPLLRFLKKEFKVKPAFHAKLATVLSFLLISFSFYLVLPKQVFWVAAMLEAYILATYLMRLYQIMTDKHDTFE